ncbi:MAG TPA: FkbM family methyltransferase [Thermoleophilaceae bacterium]|nr:FkbM family methyltransferase [Thermoleophilaceae bacterium]
MNRLRDHLPWGVRERIRAVRRRLPRGLRPWIVAARLVPGGEDRRRFVALTQRRWEGTEPVEVPLRPLGGARVAVRPGGQDPIVVQDTFVARYHLPPPGSVPGGARVIWDLGSNIGLTAADMAVRYPSARVFAVELDPANAAMCERNLASWADRVEVVGAGVWVEDGELRFSRAPGRELEARVEAVAEGGEATETAPALSLDTLLERSGGGRVDYVKMDIEGAEREVLRRNTGWAASVGAIKVECHDPYSVEECVEDLRALGFDARRDHSHWACAAGVRR